eukprot:14899-Pelagomonas_calceolata.AAC.1
MRQCNTSRTSPQSMIAALGPLLGVRVWAGPAGHGPLGFQQGMAQHPEVSAASWMKHDLLTGDLSLMHAAGLGK